MKIIKLIKDYIFLLRRRKTDGLIPMTREAEKHLKEVGISGKFYEH